MAMAAQLLPLGRSTSVFFGRTTMAPAKRASLAIRSGYSNSYRGPPGGYTPPPVPNRNPGDPNPGGPPPPGYVNPGGPPPPGFNHPSGPPPQGFNNPPPGYNAAPPPGYNPNAGPPNPGSNPGYPGPNPGPNPGPPAFNNPPPGYNNPGPGGPPPYNQAPPYGQGAPPYNSQVPPSYNNPGQAPPYNQAPPYGGPAQAPSYGAPGQAPPSYNNPGQGYRPGPTPGGPPPPPPAYNNPGAGPAPGYRPPPGPTPSYNAGPSPSYNRPRPSSYNRGPIPSTPAPSPPPPQQGGRVKDPYANCPLPPAAQVELVRSIRDRTGASMNEVTDILSENNWNEDAAMAELRKKAAAEAAKLSTRLAAEGLFGITHFDSDRSAAIVEINSETDSVAKNELFQNVVMAVSKAATKLKHEPDAPGLNLEELTNMTIEVLYRKQKRQLTVREALNDVASRTKENIKLRRAFHYTSPRGVVGSYWHMSPMRDGLGSATARVLGLCKLEVPEEFLQHDATSRLSGDIAMHVVAVKPMFLSRADVRPEVLEQELNLSRAQAAGGRTSAFDKMVDGRVGKYYEDVVLLEQKFVANESKTIQDLVDNTSKTLKKPVKILSFTYMQVGEGLEKAERNFALDIGQRIATVPNRPSSY